MIVHVEFYLLFLICYCSSFLLFQTNIDDQGKVLRMQKMLMKDVYRLLGDGERILVHVDDLSQPIKAAGGLCTRFMTLLIGQFTLVPPISLK